MSEHAAAIPRYRSLRQTQQALHTKLLRYLPKRAMEKAARKLGILVSGKTFFLDSEAEMNALVDWCIYDFRDTRLSGNPKNAAEKMLEQDRPPENSDEMIMLQANLKAIFTLLVVRRLEPGTGIHVIDLLNQEELFVYDENLSKSAVPSMGLATRLVQPEGITMTTGALLPFNPFDGPTGRALLAKANSMIGEQNREAIRSMASTGLSAPIIRTLLAAGAAKRVVCQ